MYAWGQVPHEIRHQGNAMRQQRAATTHLLEGPKSRTPTTPGAVEGRWQQGLWVPAGRQSRAHTAEGSSAVSYKMKHDLTIRSNMHASRYLPKRVRDLRPHENLHTDV